MPTEAPDACPPFKPGTPSAQPPKVGARKLTLYITDAALYDWLHARARAEDRSVSKTVERELRACMAKAQQGGVVTAWSPKATAKNAPSGKEA
jgi:hypothetical protein